MKTKGSIYTIFYLMKLVFSYTWQIMIVKNKSQKDNSLLYQIKKIVGVEIKTSLQKVQVDNTS